MDALITLDQLKRYARIEHDFETELLEELCLRATVLVIHRIEAEAMVETSPVAWTLTSLPEDLRVAILEVATNLYRHRGDAGLEDGPITKRVETILYRYRRPALA